MIRLRAKVTTIHQSRRRFDGFFGILDEFDLILEKFVDVLESFDNFQHVEMNFDKFLSHSDFESFQFDLDSDWFLSFDARLYLNNFDYHFSSENHFDNERDVHVVILIDFDEVNLKFDNDEAMVGFGR
jgi:hypothetical protein